MQPFSDKPYRFFEPRYKPRIASLLRAFGRRVVLPVDRRIARVDTAGGELVREARGNGTRILFLPNHPTGSDVTLAYYSRASSAASRRRISGVSSVLRSSTQTISRPG